MKVEVLRICLLAAFVFYLAASGFSLQVLNASAQSQPDEIYDALEQVVEEVGKIDWEVIAPTSYEIYDLYSPGSDSCGGYRLVLFVSGKYWGDGTIYDCPDVASAASLYNSLPYPTEAWNFYLPTASSTGLFSNAPTISDQGSHKVVHYQDQFIEKQVDGTNFAAWQGPRDSDFKFVQWFSIYDRTLVIDSPVFIEAISPRGRNQTTDLAELIQYEVSQRGLLSSGSGKSSVGNQDPIISGLSMDPQKPTSVDTIVFNLKVEDPDGDTLTFIWYLDGEAQSGIDKPNPIWRTPDLGNHDIAVTVSDGRGGEASTQMDFYVSERVGAGDMDNDGFLDDEDRCKTRAGFIPDGCPPFEVKVSCFPEVSTGDKEVTCTAAVSGEYDGESLEYDWYLNQDAVQSSSSSSWSWAKPEFGSHLVEVIAIGDLRQTEAKTDLKVGGVTGSSIAGFGISALSCTTEITSDDTLSCKVVVSREDSRVGSLNVLWSIDGKSAKLEIIDDDTSTLVLDEPAPGDHLVEVLVTDSLTNLSVQDGTYAIVHPGMNAAIPPIAQFGAAAGSLAAVGGWLWLEWLRARRVEQEASTPRSDLPEWMDPNRSLKDIWKQQAAEEIARRGLKGARYDSLDGLIFYDDDFFQARVREEIRKLILAEEQKINLLLDKLPPSRWGVIEDLQEKIIESINPNADLKSDKEALRRIIIMKRALFRQAQAITEAQSADEQWWAAVYQAGEDAATYVRWGAIVAGFAGPAVFELLGYGALTLAQQATAAGINLLGNFIEGTVEGYFEGGAKQAVIKGAQYTLPVNAVTEIYKTARGDYKKDSYFGVGARIGFSALRDLGNAIGLKTGIKGLSQTIRSAKYPPNVLHRATRKVDDLGRQLIDAEWRAGVEESKNLIDEFTNTLNRYNNPATSGAERSALEKTLEGLTARINSKCQAKLQLKSGASGEVTRAFNTEVNRINKKVILESLEDINSQGWKRGGSPLTPSDFNYVRNRLSQGTIPMDSDVALNEGLIQKLQKQLDGALPGSDEANKLSKQIDQARKMTDLTKNGQKMTPAQFSEEATDTLNQAYKKVTGQDPTEAFINVTTSQHPESYSDLNMLKNNPRDAPFDPLKAQQSAIVTAYKGQNMQKLVRQGKMKSGDAIQETFRGLGKDMTQKIEPLLRRNAGVPAGKLGRFIVLRRFCQNAGDGKISPGQALEILNNRFGMDLDGAINNIATEMEVAIRFQYSK